MGLKELNIFQRQLEKPTRTRIESDPRQPLLPMLRPEDHLPEVLDIEQIGKQWTTNDKRAWGTATMMTYSVIVGDYDKKSNPRQTHYNVTTGWTHDDKKLLDVPLIRGNPMMTRNSASTYARMLNSIRVGIPTDHIGPSDQSLSLRALGAHQFPISEAVTDQLATLDVGRRKDAVMLNGESREAGIALASAVEAPKFGVSVLDLESDAPCFAEKRGLIINAGRTALFIVTEGITAGLQFIEDPCRMAENAVMLLPDGDARKRYMNDTWMLQSGQAGYMAEQLPKNTRGRLVFYALDWWSWPPEWKSILGAAVEEPGGSKTSAYPNLEIVTRFGSHASLGRKSEVQDHGRRYDKLASMYRHGELQTAA
jgi:predicted DNA-binding protein